MQNAIAIYYYPCSSIPEFSATDLSQFLDSEEYTRYQRMHPVVAARFVQGRRMVKQLLAQQTGIPTKDLCFSYSSNGKPFPARLPEWQFSISHCPTAIAVVVAQTELGVDLEQVERGRRRQPWEMADRFMHPTTARWVDLVSADDKAERFTHLWTLMESYVKLNDSSIFVASRRMQIELHTQGEQMRVAVKDDPCCFWSWRVNDGEMILSLAAHCNSLQPTVWHWRSSGEHSHLSNQQPLSVPATC